MPPDALLTGIAVLTLLSGLSDDGPLLVAADDAQWLDRASLERSPSPPGAWNQSRSTSGRLARKVPSRGFERDFPQLLLSPLSLPDAGRLLELSETRRAAALANRYSGRRPGTRWR